MCHLSFVICHVSFVIWLQALSWWVPRPQAVPQWQLLYHALPQRASQATLLVLALSLVVVFGLQWRPHRRGPGPGLVVLSVVATMLEMPPLLYPRRTALRLFYLASFFYFFHINIIFRTAITSDLTREPLQVGATFHRRPAWRGVAWRGGLCRV